MEFPFQKCLFGLYQETVDDKQSVDILGVIDPAFEPVQHQIQRLFEDGNEKDHDFIIFQTEEILTEGEFLDDSRCE